MTRSHDFDPHCSCERCVYINLAFQESPPRVDRKLDDIAVTADRARELLDPPGDELELSKARMHARLFPEVAAAELAEQRALVEELRAQVVVARDLARQHRHELERVRDCLVHGEFDEAELILVDALGEVTVDAALAGAESQVDAALRRAGEAVVQHEAMRARDLPGKLVHQHPWDEVGDGCWDSLLRLCREGVPVYRVPNLNTDVAGDFPREQLTGLVLEVRLVDTRAGTNRVGYLRPARACEVRDMLPAHFTQQPGEREQLEARLFGDAEVLP